MSAFMMQKNVQPARLAKREGDLVSGWIGLVLVLACLVLAMVCPAATAFTATSANNTAAGKPMPAAARLDGSHHVIDRELPRFLWVDESGKLSLEQVLVQHRGDFKPTQPEANLLALGPGRVLWLHMRLSPVTYETLNWWLEFPVPFLDLVTVYQLDATGNWSWQAAGDTRANTDWPISGRFPAFQLKLTEGETQDVYVAIRHRLRQPIPVRLASDSAHDLLKQVEYLALGVVFGMVLMLLSACVQQGWVCRDITYGGCAIYPLILMLTVAAYSGVAAHLLWRNSPAWADAAPGVFSIWAAGTSLLFTRKICANAVRHRYLDQFTLGFALLTLALGLVFLVAERGGIRLLIAASTSAISTLLGMFHASLIWRRGDAVGKWVFLSCLPQAFISVLAPLQAMGIESLGLSLQYLVIAAILLNLPLLLMALRLRTGARHDLHKRKNTLETHDALTGLLIAHLFEDRLRQTLARAQRHHEPAAVLYMDLVNYEQIKRSHGTAVAEQSLLRCVIKLRRILRDVDTISRIGDARFGLVLDDVDSRIDVLSRAAQLIASGLMPLAGLKPDVILRFHFAVILLAEHCPIYEELTAGLTNTLAQMSPRTRRPIRFLEPGTPPPEALKPDSSGMPLDVHDSARLIH